ncbi:ABC transporter transmembrane domain-containing protein [Rhodococcus erythropolis]|uniref:ABC transporter transmembrane domain-containing protein n=1 Tax=Rhodococcus erythropolis TaxID=1833 RepID=UPI003981A13C
MDRLALSGVAITEAAFSGFQYYMLSKIGESFVLGLRTSLIGRLLRIPIREHDRRSTGDLISRFSNDTNSIKVALQLCAGNQHEN